MMLATEQRQREVPFAVLLIFVALIRVLKMQVRIAGMLLVLAGSDGFRLPGAGERAHSTCAFRQRCKVRILPKVTPRGRATSHLVRSGSTLSGLHLSVSSVQATLHADPSFCLTAILLLSTFGISLERRTVIGKALSAPLATMALALTVANVGLVPFSSPIYTMINRYLVPLAVPMLLFDSDLRRVYSDTGSLLLAFGVGAAATVFGTVVAYPLLPLRSLGNDGWRIASALAARHIGGAINFVAVAETLQIGGTAVSAAIAADNVVVAIYFAILFGLAKPDESTPHTVSSSNQNVESEVNHLSGEDADISLSTIGLAFSMTSSLVTTGGILTKVILPTGASSLPLTSGLTVVAATLFPKFFARLRKAGTAMGILFIQMFFAASGAAGSIRLVLRQAPSLFAFSALQIGIHFCFLMAFGRGLFRLPARELYLASNAAVGGPTTAAAMAQAKNWKRLVLPALLIGILGYATATVVALALGQVLLRMPLVGG